MPAMNPSIERVYSATGLTPAELALAINESEQTVSNWKVRGISKKGAIKVAEKYNLSLDWILTGKGPAPVNSSQSQAMGDMAQSQTQGVQWPAIADLPARHDGQPPSKQTPVISWVAAGDFTEVLSSDLTRVIEWIPYNPRAGKYGFALIVEGVSMEPKFMPEDRIYVNPTFQLDELHTGDLVIMSCDGDEKATFKELVVEGSKYYLRPLNPNWMPQLMPIDEHCRLVGKVVGRFNNFE